MHIREAKKERLEHLFFRVLLLVFSSLDNNNEPQKRRGLSRVTGSKVARHARHLTRTEHYVTRDMWRERRECEMFVDKYIARNFLFAQCSPFIHKSALPFWKLKKIYNKNWTQHISIPAPPRVTWAREEEEEQWHFGNGTQPPRAERSKREINSDGRKDHYSSEANQERQYFIRS